MAIKYIKGLTIDAPLSIFYSYRETRYICVQYDLWDCYIERAFRYYSDELNRIIQTLNMCSKKMLIPYYRIQPKRIDKGTAFNRNVSGVLRCRKKGKGEKKTYYNPKGISDGVIHEHVIDLLLCSEYQTITASNSFCFKALGNIAALKRILTDVLLDDAVCNSYFGIDWLTDERLSYLNKCKMKFIRDNKLKSQYRIDEEDLDNIYSLPFASLCRNNDDFNPRKYMNLWESFIAEYYNGQSPFVPSIEEQLVLHEQYEQLPDRLIERIKAKSEGAYLVLRVDKEPKEDNKEIIEAIFGMDSSVGKIKIVPITEFYKEDYQFLIRTFAVSAFKVVNKKT